METNFSRAIRVSLVRTAEQTFVPTVRVSGNTARAATIVPQVTPGLPLRQSHGPHYNAFVVANLYPDPLQCTPSEPREYQLLGQPRLDWLWTCTATQPGAHSISVSIEVRWEPDTDIGLPKGPSVVWTESLEIEVDQPLIPSPLLGFFSLGSGLLGSVLSAPWVLQRMRDTGGKRRSRVDHSKLRRMLADHFNREELRELCADLCIEYENLPDTLDGMVRELVAYCERHRRIPELLAVAKQQRAELPWPEVTIDD
jgi:hypothetical protein